MKATRRLAGLSRGVLALTTILLLVGMVPGGGMAAHTPLQVDTGNFDITYTLAVGSLGAGNVAGGAPFNALCFVDDDGSGTYTPGEAVYAAGAGCGGNVAGSDLRVTSTAGQPMGSQVRASHSDFGNPYDAFTAGCAGGSDAEIDFYDEDGNGVYDLGDPVYVDVCDTGQVAVGDIHLTGANAGKTVKSGSSRVNNALTQGAGGGSASRMDVTNWDFYDRDGDATTNGWTAGDVAYVDTDGNGLVTTADIRLSRLLKAGAGVQVQPSSPDATFVLATNTGAIGIQNPFQALCFVDDDGSGSYNPGESVYAATGGCGGGVTSSDLRLTSAAGQDPGTKVRATSTDFGNPYTAFTGTGNDAEIDFYDNDGDSFYSLEDPVYVDIGDTGGVSVGDIHLTGAKAGQTVKDGDADVNNGLNTASGDGSANNMDVTAWTFLDADSNLGWDLGDVAYIDSDIGTNGAGYASPTDVRLGDIVGESFGSQVEVLSADTTVTFIPQAQFLTGTPVVFIDDDNNGNFDSHEPVYFNPAGTPPTGTATNTGGGDLRIGNVAPPHELGSKVRAGDSDFGKPMTAFPGAAGLTFYDADGDSAFTHDDALYWDSDGSGTVTVNDLYVTGGPPGALVNNTSPNLNSPLTNWPGQIVFFDTDGDGRWTLPDIVYADTNGDGLATTMDVGYRLPWGPVGTPPPGGAPTDGGTTDGTTDGEDGTTDGDQTDGTDGETVRDEQARQDAQEAKQSAQEAKQSAQEAQRTAQEAKDAAEQARDSAQDTQRSVNNLADQLNKSGQNGSPGFGVLAALGAVVGLAAVLKLRD